MRPRYHSMRVITFTEGETMTQQSHKDQTDVNAIVARFDRTGYMPPEKGQRQYGDVTALQGELTDLIEKSRSDIKKARDFTQAWRPAPPLTEEKEKEPTKTPENPV